MSVARSEEQFKFSLLAVFILVALCAMLFAAILHRSAFGFLLFFTASIAWATRVRHTYFRRSLLLFLGGWAAVCFGTVPFHVSSEMRPTPIPSLRLVAVGALCAFCGTVATIANLLDYSGDARHLADGQSGQANDADRGTEA